MDSPKRCAVLVPVFREIEPAVKPCLQKLADRGYAVRQLTGCSDIVMARSYLATQALKDGFRELLWIDSDVRFDPDDVERLRGHNLPMTCGLYVKKKTPPEFACQFADDVKGKELVLGKDAGLLALRRVGMGFVHTRRETYERIQEKFAIPECGGGYDGKPVVPYFLPAIVADDDGKTVYLGEDLAFLDRARAVGVRPVADLAIRLDHVEGRRFFGWDDFLEKPEYNQLRVRIEVDSC